MKKVHLTPNLNWEKSCDDLGFYFHSVDGKYWIEDYAFEFSQKEIDLIEKAGNELQAMCIDLVSDTIKNGDMDRYAIDPYHFAEIENSWKRKDFHLYGRFDLSYDGIGFPKLLEYNADTPMSIIESGIIQKNWYNEHKFTTGQFNYLEEDLTERFKQWKTHNRRFRDNLHLACDSRSQEEWCNLEYLKEIAIKAGINAKFITLEDIIWNDTQQIFLDMENNHIEALFKIYPWEFLIKDMFYPHIATSQLEVLEPMWKMLISTKSILPLLWEKHEGHPNLLPSFFSEEKMKSLGVNYVKKPIYSREGENIEVYEKQNIVDNQVGNYGSEGFIYQQRKDVMCFDNRYSMIGLWIVGDKASGIGIREDASIITKDTSWFVPHYIK